MSFLLTTIVALLITGTVIGMLVILSACNDLNNDY